MTTIYVSSISSPGEQIYNGTIPESDGKGEGPLGSLDQARAMALRLREQNRVTGTINIVVRGGRYELVRPLEFGPEDRDLLISAYEGEEPIFDGSLRITGWEVSEINGTPCWVADVSRQLEFMTPRSLFANNERRPRSRYPKEGWLTMEEVPDLSHLDNFALFDGSSRFRVREGDFSTEWKNRQSIEAVVNHLWIEERMPVQTYDAETRMMRSTHSSIFTLRNKEWMDKEPNARYYWENVFEALSEPGQWYCDTEGGKLYYLPKEGETPENTEIRLPHLKQLLRIHGNDETGDLVRGIHFEGITFQNTDWTPAEGWAKWWDPRRPEHEWKTKDSFQHFDLSEWNRSSPWKPGTKFAAVPQGAHDLPGAISYEFARDCSFTNCKVQRIGFYAIDVRHASSFLRFSGNQISDIGGGGIKLDGSNAKGNPAHRTHRIYFGDNKLIHCGQVYSSAIGVFILHSGYNRIEYNEITEQKYTAISVGWQWDYDENCAGQNLIQYNRISKIGLGIMSDLGCIYTLGYIPGTVIRGNVCSDARSNHYGGNGIYLDEGSSGIRVEGNLVYNTGTLVHEHWGRQNVIMNNVFAFGEQKGIQIAREQFHGSIDFPPRGTLFMKNVLVMPSRPFFQDHMRYLDLDLFQSDLNLFWDPENDADSATYWDYAPWPDLGADPKKYTLAEIQKEKGLELNSLFADPGFTDPRNGDFTVGPDSPVHKLGIRLADASKAGVRPVDQRTDEAVPTFRNVPDAIFQ